MRASRTLTSLSATWSTWSLSSLALVALFALTGCSDDAPQQTASNRKAPKPPAPTELAQDSEGEAAPYHYDRENKPDPFASFILAMRDMEARDAAATPLERFDLSQLDLSAIIWGTDRPRALVLDPSGKGYIVSVGTPIGKNEGRVVFIDDNAVVVKETYVDYRGQATTKDISLKLHARGG